MSWSPARRAWLAFFPSSGELLWTPKDSDLGTTYPVTVRATDLSGAQATQSFAILVNHDPVITSTPPHTSVAISGGYRYTYDVDAIDPDAQSLTYRVVTGPAGMTIEATTGVLTWTTASGQGGSRWAVEVEVTDGFGGSARQSFVFYAAVASPANRAPVITSTPAAVAHRLQQYQYQIVASDPDGDALLYRLVQAPSGMQLSPTGLVTWTPNYVQVGSFVVELEVWDGFSGVTPQAYTVSADYPTDNSAPHISTEPVLTVAPGAIYGYDVDAVDPDNNLLKYFLDQAPAGMVIDGETGQILWQPAVGTSGRYPVSVRVSDGRGGIDVQSFEVGVGEAGVFNHAPSITSTAPTTATARSAYTYAVTASDVDGDTLAFALTVAPAGMSIDAATGAIAWTPTAQQVGSASVTVHVTDGRGGSASQPFSITVAPAPNSAPQFATAPPTAAKATREYRYDADATDVDGDPLTYSFSSAPAGMTIDATTGLIRWTPDSAGSAAVVVRASDGRAYTEQSFTIDVVLATTALAAQLSATPQYVAAGADVSATLTVTGAAGQLSAVSTLDGAPIALAINGTAHLSATAIGRHDLATTVTDGYDSAPATASFYVVDPSDSSDPVVQLTTPADAAKVTAPTSVRGTVTDDHLASWLLAYRPANSPNDTPIVLAQGTNTFTDAALAQFDPTQLINGQYTLILQATDTSGHVGYDSAVVRVAGDMKVGNFSITFEDVSLPVAGIPVRVTRTYDSRRRNENLDFGKGWSVDYQNVRISESHAMGFAWSLDTVNQGGFNNYCVKSNGDRVVTITLPDGKLETFKAKAEPECPGLGGATDALHLVFEPIDNTFSTLEQTDYGLLKLATIAGSPVTHLVEIDTPNVPADPRHYKLTTVEGMVYELDQRFGITRIVEPNGNTLTYSPSGIEHSTGVAVVFHRD
ncbi:MAG TPA: putative Ig domain-containing protein, partial [Acidimicrobiales bacterium]|nr:putative Ig domain-containing protein [Acidimicrobiales bacterium]